MKAIIAAAALSSLACGLEHQVITSATRMEEALPKNRPVAKVIALLQHMYADLQKDQKEDQIIYDRMHCWCITYEEDKKKEIERGKNAATGLGFSVEEMEAAVAVLETEIKNLNKELTANIEALAKATAIRNKELTEFHAEEQDMMQTVVALRNAVMIMKKHNSLSQIPRGTMLSLAATIQRHMQKSRLADAFTPSERKKIAYFFNPSSSFLQAPGGAVAHSAQSSEIFGVLSEMKDSFENDLKEDQAAEAMAAETFRKIKLAKNQQIKEGKELIARKTQEVAETNQKIAQAKLDLTDTFDTLESNERFLEALLMKCKLTDEEWEKRQANRNAEIKAVADALSLLNSDEAHHLFTRNYNRDLSKFTTSFMQMESSTSSKRRAAAAKLLFTASKMFKSPRLSSLSEKVRLDTFNEVKKAIDDMVSELTKEKKAEIKHKDWCREELFQNQMKVEERQHTDKVLQAKIRELDMALTSLPKEIKQLQDDVQVMERELKEAGEDREKENMEFSKILQDQQNSRTVLTQALEMLKAFYQKQALVQKQPAKDPFGAGAAPGPPPGFQKYMPNDDGNGVIKMIQDIIFDTTKTIWELQIEERVKQRNYEGLVIDTSDVVQKKSADLTHKQTVLAKKESAHIQAKQTEDDYKAELKILEDLAADLHKSCDYVLKNFDARQQARDEEINALKAAKDILNGSNFQEFLQDPEPLDPLHEATD